MRKVRQIDHAPQGGDCDRRGHLGRQSGVPMTETGSVLDALRRGHERVPAYWFLCGLLLALSAVPLFVGLYPPFIDYPSHLGRIAMLADWNASAFVREHYQISSWLLANLSLEMVMLPLSKVMPAEVAGDLFILITFALLLFGTVTLHRTLFGKRSMWPLVSAAWLYNWIVLYGFLNYVFGVAVMLWCLAAYLRLSERAWWIRVSAGMCFTLVLFLCHLFAVALYAFAIAGFELQRFLLTWHRERRLDWQRLVIGAAQFIPAMLTYVAISPTRSITARPFIYNFPLKWASLLVTFTSGNVIMDGLTIAFFVGAAVVLIRRANIEISEKFIGALIGLVIALVVAPRTVQHPGPAFVDIRVPLALVFTSIAATRVTFRSPLVAQRAAAIFGAYLVLKIAVISASALEYREVVHGYLAAFNRLERGSTLFAARQQLDDSFLRRFYVDRILSPRHADAFAVIRREVFVPGVFATPGGQPIQVRPRFQPLKVAQGDEPVEVRDASALAGFISEVERLQRSVAPGKAAYLLMQDRGEVMALPASAEVVATGPGFRLAKIGR